jgi:hypothetical protein
MATNADGSYKLDDDGVASRVAKITSGGSDLMKMARTQGLQATQRRGLGNSSMAVGAAEMAALNAAVPIASQEASQVAQRNVTGMGLAAEDARLTRTIGADDNRLTRQIDADMERTRLGLDSEAERQRVAIGAEDTRLGRQIDADMSRLNVANEAEVERARMAIAADQQRAMLSGVTDITSNRFNALSNTLQNDKIPAATRAAVQASIDGQYQQAMDQIQNIYGVNIQARQQAMPTQQAPVGNVTLTPAQIEAIYGGPAFTRGGLGI